MNTTKKEKQNMNNTKKKEKQQSNSKKRKLTNSAENNPSVRKKQKIENENSKTEEEDETSERYTSCFRGVCKDKRAKVGKRWIAQLSYFPKVKQEAAKND